MKNQVIFITFFFIGLIFIVFTPAIIFAGACDDYCASYGYTYAKCSGGESDKCDVDNLDWHDWWYTGGKNGCGWAYHCWCRNVYDNVCSDWAVNGVGRDSYCSPAGSGADLFWTSGYSSYEGGCGIGSGTGGCDFAAAELSECPSWSSSNGESCNIYRNCNKDDDNSPNNVVECGDCQWHSSYYGKWDASENQCVKCDNTYHKKTHKYGDTSGFYVSCMGNILSTGDITDKCESACGASSYCDEKDPGNACGAFSEEGLGCDGYKRRQYNGGDNCVFDSPAGSCNSTCGCDPPGQNKKYIPGQCKLCPFGTIDCSKSGNVTVSSDCDVYDSMHQPNGDITIKSGVIVTIKDNSTLTFSPGYSIFIEDGGYILISTNNGKIQQQ